MKLKTSFFNATLFRKNLTRFAPIWIVLLVELLISLNSVDAGLLTSMWYGAGYNAYILAGQMGYQSIISLVYALICASFLFGDLFNTKLCNALHALPLRRETWFGTNVISGLVFFLGPVLLASLAYMVLCGSKWFVGALWLLCNVLQYLFFFGVAVLCVMVSGSRIGMVVSYGVINFLSIIAYALCALMVEPYLIGVTVPSMPFLLLSPVMYMCAGDAGIGELVHFEMEGGPKGCIFEEYRYVYAGLGSGWWYLAVAAVLGLAFMALALVLYRKRQLECAGDLVAFRCLWPVITLACGICGGLLFYLIGGMLTMVIGIFLGYMGCQMLLQRKVNVFKGKAFLGFGILAGIMMLLPVLALLDPIGVTRWTPEADEVESVTISEQYYYDEEYTYYDAAVILTDPEQIEDLIRIHEILIDERYASLHATNTTCVYMCYQLSDGRQVTRRYEYPRSSTAYEELSKYFQSPEYILGYQDWAEYLNQVDSVSIDDTKVGNGQAIGLLEAIRQDCQEGNMDQNDSALHYVEIIDAKGYSDYMIVTADSHHTLAWIKENYPGRN